MNPRPQSRSTVRRAVTAALSVLAASGAFTASSVAGAAAPTTTHARGALPAHVASESARAISACATSSFIPVAGQGSLCRSGPSWVMSFGHGRAMTVSAPDMISVLAAHPASAAARATAPLQAAQCVDPAQHTHVELYYAHFAGQPDNFASHVADIQQMFRDVDQSYLDYDALTYFGIDMHLYVECDGNGNPVVHDIALSTPLNNSDFDTIVTDMINQGHTNNLAHYWVWTDGNPEASLGYAGQSTIEEDDTAGASNAINQNYEFSVNYGFTESNGGSQIFAHENGHAMGAVQLSAPDSTGLWHCTDGYDVMCYDDGGPKGNQYTNRDCGATGNGTLFFDCHFNDYFNPQPSAGSYLATHWDVAAGYNAWVLLEKASSSTGVTASGGTAVYSQPVTLTATVRSAGGGGVPSGSVTFSDGGTSLGSAALNGAGVATLTTTALGLGGNSITASYSGSNIYNPSTSSGTTVQVSQASSSTSLSASANPAPLNTPITLTATVAPVSPATAAPAGSVTFYAGGTSLGTASLSGGTASISASFGLGAHTLTAVYAGSAAFGGSDDTGSPLTLTVQYAAAAAITSSAPQQTAEYSTPLTFSATVDAASGTPHGLGPPTGSVSFEDGGTVLATVALSGDQASFTTASLAAGTHQVSAVYSGDGTFAPATATLTETVTSWTGFADVDAFGAVHPLSTSGLAPTSALWPGWPIARGGLLRADGTSGYVLDGFGGLHPFGGAPSVAVTGYWPGWDIARGAALRSNGRSGYVLDAYGGIHPFGGAPDVVATAYWRGWDIARGIVLRPDGQSGYVLDGYGGVHPFGVSGDVPAAPHVSAYWLGWSIANSLTIDADGNGGYVLDGFGGLHPFGNAPSVTTPYYWPGWDIARSLVLVPGPLHIGYVLDGWGGLHPFGAACSVPVSGGEYTPGRDVQRTLAIT